MDLELALGKAQHRALCFAAARAAGLRRSHMTIARAGLELDVPYLYRGLEGAASDVLPTVFVHGFGDNKETWLLMCSAISRSRPIVLFDLPGFGEASAIPGQLASPRAQADTLLRIVDALGLSRINLVANSMGGGISLRAAHQAPTRVGSLVLINTIGPELVEQSEFWRRLQAGQNTLIPRDGADAAQMLEMVMARPPRLPRSLLRYAAARQIAARDQLTEIFQSWQSCSPADAVPADLEAIDVPALVVCGERDRIIHPATSRSIASRMPHAELRPLAHLGHMPQIEAPFRTGRLVEEFLARFD
ncbi:MAG: alpha/beta fold hydrolase [Proteobacteria bacterium]|nr:alpha/beta fold hydrolase [Pseudomonadota bacterium]